MYPMQKYQRLKKLETNNTFTAKVEEDENGEQYILFPDGTLDDWLPDDKLEWILNDDKTIILVNHSWKERQSDSREDDTAEPGVQRGVSEEGPPVS